MITIAERIPAAPEPEPPDAALPQEHGPYAVVLLSVLEEAIAALAPSADFAGSLEVLGRPDSDIVNPHFRAGHYRSARAVRARLIEELARD